MTPSTSTLNLIKFLYNFISRFTGSSTLPTYGSMDKMKGVTSTDDFKKLFPERAHLIDTKSDQGDDEDIIFHKSGKK